LRGFETGTLAADEFILVAQRALGVEAMVPATEFWPVYRDIFDVDPEVVAIYLAAKAYVPDLKIVACSDTDPVRWAHLDNAFRRKGLRLDGGAFSFDVGSRKPDRAMFVRASEVAGVPLGRCLFVDDLERNVSAATEAGMRSHWFNPADPGRHAAFRRALGNVGACRDDGSETA
jgi:FMN phosphatase YigB (HAD superfamily)